MKIAIPVVDTDKKKNIIAAGLNVLGSLCIYDPDVQTSIWVKTLDLAPNMGMLLPALEEKKVLVIISQQVHPIALKVFVKSGFDVFRAIGRDVKTNLQLWESGKLVMFNTESNIEFSEMCGDVCDSCVDECDSENS